MRLNGFDDILEGFNPSAPAEEAIRSGAPVTIWLRAADKARYDHLQEVSKGRGRRFSDVARQMLKALIEEAEKKVAG